MREPEVGRYQYRANHVSTPGTYEAMLDSNQGRTVQLHAYAHPWSSHVFSAFSHCADAGTMHSSGKAKDAGWEIGLPVR